MLENKSNENKRNSSIELLRIFAEIGVIIFHINSNGNGLLFAKQGLISKNFVFFLESISSCSVNLFILISAYYLSSTSTSKRKASKIIELMAQVVFFKIGYYLLSVLLKQKTFLFSVFLVQIFPANYFVMLYGALYIVSPYINILVNSINKRQMENFVIVIFSIFSIWSFFADLLLSVGVSETLSTISMFGSQKGYTIVNFIIIYLLGAYIRKYDINLSKKNIIILVIINAFTLFIFSLITEKMWQYNNPLVISLAFLFFSLFKDMKFENNTINKIAKSSFTCFLINDKIISLFKISESMIKIPIYLGLYYFIFPLIIFLISYFVYVVYNFMISKTIMKIINKIDYIDIYKIT